jgi:HAD superfamily phosphatase (TIGR01681 family)
MLMEYDFDININEINEKKNIKLIIFDLDDTLIKTYNDYIFMCHSVEPILQYLKSKNIKIGLASYNANAGRILKNINLIKYFDVIKYETWTNYYDLDFKRNMLKNIINYTQIPHHEVLFLDDNARCLYTAESLGINTSLVINGNIIECIQEYLNIDDFSNFFSNNIQYINKE